MADCPLCHNEGGEVAARSVHWLSVHLSSCIRPCSKSLLTYMASQPIRGQESRSRSEVRFQLLVMCRSMGQTSYSILPLYTQQKWVPSWTKSAKIVNGISCRKCTELSPEVMRPYKRGFQYQGCTL